MKCEIVIDKACEPKVVVYAYEHSPVIDDIKHYVENCDNEIIGYSDTQAVKLNLYDIYCISIINGKVFAICKEQKFLLKTRLFSLEEILPQNFVKINQSCIANINKIDRFDVSLSASLMIYFKNGYSDYVSRRQLKNVKERLKIK